MSRKQWLVCLEKRLICKLKTSIIQQPIFRYLAKKLCVVSPCLCPNDIRNMSLDIHNHVEPAIVLATALTVYRNSCSFFLGNLVGSLLQFNKQIVASILCIALRQCIMLHSTVKTLFLCMYSPMLLFVIYQQCWVVVSCALRSSNVTRISSLCSTFPQIVAFLLNEKADFPNHAVQKSQEVVSAVQGQ